jgi:hypothetical protein
MTKLEELKAVCDAAHDAWIVVSEDAWDAYDAAWDAYQEELNKTKGE